MNNLSKAFALMAVLALSACANPDRFGGTGNTVDLNSQAGLNDPSLNDAATNSPAYFSQTVGDRILFAVDESTINPTARQTLLSQANWLLGNRDYAVIIEGHADEQGTREYNLALGARRASAVQQFLIAQGVAPGRVRTVTYGKERPIEICSDEACYTKNRRAVTVLNAGGTS